MKVKVTTHEFIRLLQAAKEFDQQFPWLGQVVWLLDHWTDVTDDYVAPEFPGIVWTAFILRHLG